MTRTANTLSLVSLAAGLWLAFRQPLRGLVDIWSVSPMYSHAFVVPFISLGLLWARRDDFRAATPRPARLAAAPIIALSLLALLVGEIAGVQIVAQLAFVVIIAGIVLFLFGVDHLRLSAPAIGYLLFMVPFWETLTERLHQPFQDNSATIGVALLRIVGVPAYRDGTVIALPNVVIEVARACSGVNYLVAVLALALPLSVLRLHSWRRRLTLIGAAVAISAFANGLRVGLIGWLAYLEFGSPLHGPFHVLHGLFVAGVGYVVLFAGLAWMERREPPVDRVVRPRPAASGRPSTADAMGLAALLLLAAVGTSRATSEVVLASTDDQLLPIQLGEWRAVPDAGSGLPATAAWADSDVHVNRAYRKTDGTPAAVDIWYYSRQTQRKEVVNFRVAELHRRATRQQIPLPGGGTLSANLVSWPDRRAIAVFWYEVDGTAEAHEYLAKMRSVWSVLRAGRSDAAAVMLTMDVSQQESDVAVARLKGLAALVHMQLTESLSAHGKSTP